jgi:hypothetical protein
MALRPAKWAIGDERGQRPFPAGFLIQLSAFLPAERRFLWKAARHHLTGT